MEHKKDIFISYKNDGEGNNFAARLCSDLEKLGYDVYYNPNEQHAGSFPDRLRNAVESCKDFLLIVTQTCLDQLIRHDKIDWVREELLTALKSNKKIIPLLMPGVTMPKDKDDMPEDLRFLPDKDAISIAEPYNKAPLDILLSWMFSKPEKEDAYKYSFNDNKEYNVNQDFTETLALAQSGNVKAMYEVANMYFYGFTDESGQSSRSFAKAYEWFKKVSETENDYTELADSMIAKMHYRGVVPREKQSYAKSLKYHKKAANKSGYSKQQYAFMLSMGMGCNFDFEAAEQQYLCALEGGDNVLVNDLAQLYTRYGYFSKAAELYKKLIDSFPQAAYKLGLMYAQGVLSSPPCPDNFKAAFYFDYATKRKNANADVYYQLALLYFRGSNGFINDYKIAQENFIIAAEKGHAAAQYMLGYMYEHGHVEIDIDKAIYYHSLAVENGHVLSPTHLSILYQLPSHQNYYKAFQYAKMAAENGEKEGEFVYGNLLFFGRGCKADIDKAYEAYTNAYNHGCDQAKFMIERIEHISK